MPPENDEEAMHPVLVGRLIAIEKELAQGRDRMGRIEDSIVDNTEMTATIRDIVVAGKTGFKVLGWIGTAAKWIAAVGGAVVAVYAVVHAIKTGHPPPKP